MEHKISKFCIKEYEPLKEYFGDLQVADFLGVDKSEILYSFPEKIRFLAMIFLKNSVLKCVINSSSRDVFNPEYLDYLDYNHNEENINNNEVYKNYDDTQELIKLDLSRKISSSYYDPEKIYINQISRLLENSKNKIYLDMTWNGLYIDNISSIVDLIIKYNNISILNISCNNIDLYRCSGETKIKIYKYLHEILGYVDFLDITLNLITYYNFDEYGFIDDIETITPEYFDKLIWIPEKWITHDDWKVMIKNRKYDKRIINTHCQYYKINKKYMI
jgi:hypothetical protein